MFRRSGSFACYFVEGSTPDPRSQEFLDALAEHRFRTIENAAAEQTSAGWVTSGDPSDPERPIFVIGCGRSGTTVVFHALAEHCHHAHGLMPRHD